MKTQAQVDVLDQATADTEMYGQKLTDAVCKAYFAAKEDDTETVAQAFAEASEHQKKINEVMADAQAAVIDLTDAPAERNLEGIDLDALEDAVLTVARMSAFVELIAHAYYARWTIEVESIATPDSIDSVRFSQRLSRDLHEASRAIEGRQWDKALDGIQGAMADLAILRAAIGSKDERYAELLAAEHVFDEIDRIEQFVHEQRKTSEVRS